MVITNHDRVGKAFALLRAGLGPFDEREVKSAVAANGWVSRAYAGSPTVRSVSDPYPSWMSPGCSG